MNRIILILILIFFSSCSNDDNKVSPNLTNIDFKYYIEIKNHNGLDLLNPNNIEAFNEKDIKIVTIDEKGKIEELKNNTNQKLINSSKKEDGKEFYFIYTSAYSFINHNTSIIYLSLPNGDLDKITILVKHSKNSIQKDKIFYNDKLVWDTSYSNDLITIIK